MGKQAKARSGGGKKDTNCITVDCARKRLEDTNWREDKNVGGNRRLEVEGKTPADVGLFQTKI